MHEVQAEALYVLGHPILALAQLILSYLLIKAWWITIPAMVFLFSTY
jgi:hypothetical protein